jgi:STE24 endopeptidase
MAISSFPPLLAVFIAVTILTTVLDLVLSARQARYVARHRDAVPEAFAAMVDLEAHRKAADYQQARLGVGAVASVFGCAVALAWACFGYQAIFVAVAPLLPPGVPASVGFLGAVGGISWLLNLPVSVYRVFWIESRFGFNRQTLAGFAVDRLKGLALSVILGAPLLFALMWLMRQPAGSWFSEWWLWAWLGLMVLMLVMMDAYPRWIAPLFNRFTPLEGPLRTRIEALLQRCGFNASGLFVMDASRRSSHGNAYFSGLGRSKRIVLFDTLISANSEPELEAVLAHELGHFKLNHILFGLAQSAVTTFLGLFIIGWLCRQPWLLPSFGIAVQDDALALLVGLLVIQMGSPILGVAGNWLSRRHEYQADDFARRMVGAEPMASALVKLSRDNASTLTTDPWYALVNFSHPPVPDRVARLNRDYSASDASRAASSA